MRGFYPPVFLWILQTIPKMQETSDQSDEDKARAALSGWAMACSVDYEKDGRRQSEENGYDEADAASRPCWQPVR